MRARGKNGSRREQGSALLIVFVFAAMVAIFLYKEMPIAAFEAQRQKEQVLIDRGDEYKHAIKLFVRKVGRFPSSLKELEDTNHMRFLRQRYKDPLTGSDEWRLVHAGPGGVIIDSKVASNKTTLPGTNPANGSNTAAGTNTASGSNTGFGSTPTSSAFGDTSTSSDASTAVASAPAIPQRPPAMPVAGGTAATSAANQDPMTPLLTSGQAAELANNAPGAADATQAGQTTATGTAQSTGQAVAGVAMLSTDGGSPVPSGDSKQTLQNLLGTSNPTTPSPLTNTGTTQTATQIGVQAARPATTATNTAQVLGGGIAGVASKGKGHAIKRVNDQSDYSLWEFYYDMSQDLAGGARTGLQTTAGAQNGTATGSSSTSGQNSAFGFGSNTSGTSNNASGTTSGSNAGTPMPTVPQTNSPQTNPPQD